MSCFLEDPGNPMATEFFWFKSVVHPGNQFRTEMKKRPMNQPEVLLDAEYFGTAALVGIFHFSTEQRGWGGGQIKKLT